ncbi:MAG: fused MFS/spermidine synthase, partial [Actinomycetota bacterium]
GGGALTVPRWLAATRPGSDQVVLEIDAAVLDLVRAELGTPPGTRLVEGDARVTLTALPTASADLVVGDAFGSVAVPWHLATTQAAQQVRRVLRPGGLYVLNVIDRGDLALLRAEVATLRQVFGDVAVLAEPGTTRPGAEGAGGNVVLLAARGGVDAVRLDDVRVAAGDGVEVRLVTDDDPLAGGRVLTDDFAPTDQLLTPAVAPRG